MNAMLNKMFKKSDGNKPLYFEALSGQLKQLMKRKDIIKHGNHAVKQNGFTGSPMEHLPLLRKLVMLPRGLKLYNQIRKSLNIPLDKPRRDRFEDSEFFNFKTYLESLNITTYGFTKVNRDRIFVDRGIFYEYAIVISIQMPKDKIAIAPSFETMSMIEDTYAQTGEVVNKISSYLRERDFGAQAGPGLGGMTNYPYLARDAGLGEFGRSGLLITPYSGPSHRLAVVYTNITNLPIAKENRHTWVREFCQVCGICIKKCPGTAIYSQPRSVKEQYVTHIQYDKCMTYFNDHYGCSVCIKVCPFTKSGYDRVRGIYLKKQKKQIKKVS